MLRIFALAVLVVASSGQFQHFTSVAKSKQGKMCERHMQLQSCLGKTPGECRLCSNAMTKRCEKTVLKNLCHLHYSGPEIKKDKKVQQPSLSATMSKADHVSADDDDSQISVRTKKDAIVKKLAKMKGKLEAHVALIKHKQERKAEKKKLGLLNVYTAPPSTAPTYAPTKKSALNYANGVRKATLEAMGKTESEGEKLWGEVNKENAEEDKAEMQSGNGVHNTIISAVSTADSADSGESMCEEHGYNKKQCKTVGCCTFLSGLCWSAIGARMCTAAPAFLKTKVKTPAPTPQAMHSKARITKHAAATASNPTPVPAAKLNGEVACEEHGYTQQQCGAVGCCTFMSGLCWSGVGKKACASAQSAKHKHTHTHKHSKQHPLVDGKTKHKHKHPHGHHRHKGHNGGSATPYPTPHPTVATPTPTKAPTPMDKETKEENESAIEDRIFAATSSAKKNANKPVAITPAPTLESAVAKAAKTRIAMHAIQGLTKDQACSHLETLAAKTCKFLIGRGTTCAKQCDNMIEHMRSARPYLAQCDFQWKKKVHEDICWPQDCTPTIHFFCSPYMHSVLQGRQDNKVVYYDVCELCMMHYIWMKPSIPGTACWQNKIGEGFCPAGYRNLPKGSEKAQLTMHNLKKALASIPEHSMPQFRAK